MSYFNNIFLVKAPQARNLMLSQNSSDFTEICYLAAMVEDQVDAVSIPVDLFAKDFFGEYAKKLQTEPCDLVGISSLTGGYNNALHLARIAKSFDRYVVMGGYHPSALPEEVLESPYVDAVIIGEGELTFRELVLHGPSKEVAGLAYKENGNIVRTRPRPLIQELDSLPHPLRQVRPERLGESGEEYTVDTVYTSRGCPWKCTFCANDIINKKWRARSPENVLEELIRLHTPHKKKLIKIWDANFFTDIHRVEKICDLMIENNILNFKIWTEARVDDIIRAGPILSKLYKVGLRHVSIGLESPNPETLKSMKKNIDQNECAEAVSLIRKYWIKPQGYFILGHYMETEEDTKRFPEYAKKLELDKSIFMIMTPYPGTAIFEEYKKENRIKSFDWDLYNNFCPVVETRGMEYEALKHMYAYCYGKFYLYRFYITRSKNFFNILFKFFGMLNIFNILAWLNKSNTSENRKDFIFDAVRVDSQNHFKSGEDRKVFFLLRIFKSITIRIRRSPGRNVDFVFTHSGKERQIFVSETSDRRPVKGVVIDLDDVIRLSKRIPPERVMELSLKLGIQKSYPKFMTTFGRQVRNDHALIPDLFSLIWSVLKYYGRTLKSLLLFSLPIRSNKLL